MMVDILSQEEGYSENVDSPIHILLVFCFRHEQEMRQV